MTRPLDNVRATGILATVALLAGACGGARTRPAAPPPGRACAALPLPTPPVDSVAVVLTWAIDPSNAPVPSNPGERFVFAHAYQTLVRVDCLGRLVPALARSWAPVDGGAGQKLILHDSARFWNGEAVTAGDVMASWTATAGTAPAALARRLAERARVIDDRTLSIGLPDTLLAALGDRELAVARRDDQARWLEGTGPYRIRDAGPPGRAAGASVRATLLLEPVRAGEAPRLTIHSVGASDARDLVDTGIDLLLTEDPALADYAAARPEYASVPLAWDRTWVLLTPRRGPVGTSPTVATDTVAARTRGFRSTLARDAVRADARAAEGPHWWSDVSGCGALTGTGRIVPAARAGTRVAFRRNDPVARALAERLVALAAIGRSDSRDSSLALLAPELLDAGARATAAALAPNDFTAALRAGTELAFVVSLPRHSLAPCGDVERLLAAAPWLLAGSPPLALSSRVVPLIDTRLHAVARRDRLGLTVTWDSTVTITTPASTRAAAGGARP